jgi:sulfur carrier protein
MNAWANPGTTYTINGTAEPYRPLTLHELAAGLGAGKGVAVAVNGAVVPRSAWPATQLQPGDSVELLSAVQGG